MQEWIDYIAGLEDPPSPGISLSDKSLEVTGITGGVQTTSSTTLNADHRNTITLALPDNVTFHNESTGETQMGGTVTIGGGTTFHFSAPTSVSGTWKTGDMKGMIAMIWKVLVVKTGTKTQKLGSYASEEYGGSVHFIVPAGTCISTAVSDETGSVAFDIDLPLGKYLVNELQAPVGYVLSDEVIELEAAYQGQDQQVRRVSERRVRA